MTRPLRIEYPGATYHVTSRGDRREPIFRDDRDQRMLLDIVGRGMTRFDASVMAYCLMGNHYHLVLHTREANLSRVMRHINGVYSQAFNRRHSTAGHVFQGRFHAVIVDRDAYLLEVCRYVELNPVRAGFVAAPGDWPWSSFRAHTGLASTPEWLDAIALLEQLLGREVKDPCDRRLAARRYADLVHAARDVPLWSTALRQQIYLGDDAFVERMQKRLPQGASGCIEIPRPQCSRPTTFTEWLRACPTVDEALWRAYAESGVSMSAMAQQLGRSVAWVSLRIARVERSRGAP